MKMFLIGLFVGANIGFFVAGLCNAAHEPETNIIIAGSGRNYEVIHK